MNYMFGKAESFNQPLNFTSTKNVTDMSQMFFNAKSFNEPLNWDTSNVIDMTEMFGRAISFNQPLNFNTENVTTMKGMFSRAISFNQLLIFTNTKNVTNMEFMFLGAESFNQPLDFTSTTNVTNMEGMFYDAESFDQPLNFNTENVTDMTSMFEGAISFNQDLSKWCVPKIKDIPGDFGLLHTSDKLPKWGECPDEVIIKLFLALNDKDTLTEQMVVKLIKYFYCGTGKKVVYILSFLEGIHEMITIENNVTEDQLLKEFQCKHEIEKEKFIDLLKNQITKNNLTQLKEKSVIQFIKIVNDMDEDKLTKLFDFISGTSCCPSNVNIGFNPYKIFFTSHTCSNGLDFPFEKIQNFTNQSGNLSLDSQILKELKWAITYVVGDD